MSCNHDKIAYQKKALLRHVAIIMDGNSRWARKRGQLPIFGHKAGIESVKRAVHFALDHKIECLTLYAFSRENWRRPIQEINSLMQLLELAIEYELKHLHKYNICLRVIGDINFLNKNLQRNILLAENATKNNKGINLNIAINYSGQWDIIEGTKKIAQKVQAGLLFPQQIEEQTLANELCLQDLAPVDLLIRTGGEYRISNFLLWQIAYSEFWFTDVFWPDFNESIFENAINDFYLRERRFGSSGINFTKVGSTTC
ncbi:polyprenyl diphosphate synthase [Candidatus Ishikawella capsulata]|uniref:Ditrans,polycis-undecaprenyl-diphosphate synthase ((2E,6E)-farnesyl-diphosphate specific) n=1 Tax=Candidatus Ishikawaella capsulata Mpkobe TaxID=476281 RepID=C5WCK5_9ENTR|nr:polyprenyl diphosphate synthase [Candidatus Ishikawaella capsulata]BAH83061.1 undecaprenyl pyrophosphate synthase [Candidatus Ishikawaella capsulata Mpkobe]